MVLSYQKGYFSLPLPIDRTGSTSKTYLRKPMNVPYLLAAAVNFIRVKCLIWIIVNPIKIAPKTQAAAVA